MEYECAIRNATTKSNGNITNATPQCYPIINFLFLYLSRFNFSSNSSSRFDWKLISSRCTSRLIPVILLQCRHGVLDAGESGGYLVVDTDNFRDNWDGTPECQISWDIRHEIVCKLTYVSWYLGKFSKFLVEAYQWSWGWWGRGNDDDMEVPRYAGLRLHGLWHRTWLIRQITSHHYSVQLYSH